MRSQDIYEYQHFWTSDVSFILDDIEQIIKEEDVPADQVKLEITERVLVEGYRQLNGSIVQKNGLSSST